MTKTREMLFWKRGMRLLVFLPFYLFTFIPLHAQFNTDRLVMIGRSALYYEDYVLSIQYFNHKIFVKEDSIHLYMNKDGSAVLKEKMGTICPEQGEITKISIEKQEDTLLVFIKYYEYPPDTIIVYNDSLGKNDTLLFDQLRRKCMCYSDYEIEVPAEFTSAKFVGLKYSSDNTYLYPVARVLSI